MILIFFFNKKIYMFISPFELYTSDSSSGKSRKEQKMSKVIGDLGRTVICSDFECLFCCCCCCCWDFALPVLTPYSVWKLSVAERDHLEPFGWMCAIYFWHKVSASLCAKVCWCVYWGGLMCVSVCVCVCVWERERESVCVCDNPMHKTCWNYCNQEPSDDEKHTNVT